jgi:hypothetical protein
MSWSGLRSPVWWACLGILVLNDHFLKGSGVLPGWLTGKLSDFAGLVVAPVLLCAVLNGWGLPARLAAFAVVVVPFASMKLSADAARAVERAAQAFGLQWRVWVDPTDLMALAVLPVAWGLSAPRAEANLRRSVGSLLRERVGLLAGAVACLASSSQTHGYKTRIFLVNVSHRTAEMKIFRSPVPIACDVTPKASVNAATFALERCAPAMPFRSLPLDHDYLETIDGDVDETSRSAARTPARECDAVVLRTDGLPDTIVYWKDGTNKTEVRDEVENDRSDGVFLESLGSAWFVTPDATSESWPYQRVLPEVPCTAPH